jgi:hypothetical protein
MTTASMIHIPLTSAFLCLDCDRVTDSRHACPACASESLMGLSAVLNRKPANIHPSRIDQAREWVERNTTKSSDVLPAALLLALIEYWEQEHPVSMEAAHV